MLAVCNNDYDVFSQKNGIVFSVGLSIDKLILD